MKTLNEIKEEVAKELGSKNSDTLITEEGTDLIEHFLNEVARRYAMEVAKESLKNASENYTILFDGQEYAVSGINDSNNIPEL